MIDKDNPSLCPFAFEHSYISPTYERKLCCIAEKKSPPKKLSQEDFWNGEYMRDVRKKMVVGEKIPECTKCYSAESFGLPSLRKATLSKLIDDPTILENYNFETGEMKTGPTFFDHRTIHCNLQCISCGGSFSSTHQQLMQKMGSDITFPPIDSEYENQMAQEIIDSLIKKECKSLYWAGGEPLVSKIHWKVFETMKRLLEDPDYFEYLSVVRPIYTTNLTKLYWKNQSIPELLKPLNPFMNVSIDGTEETFEYCRDGAKWNEVMNNWNEYYTILDSPDFTVSSVLSAPVIFDIDRWVKFFSNYNILVQNHKMITDIKQYPATAASFLDIRLFPKQIFDRVINHAIEAFEKCNLPGTDISANILKSLIVERAENLHIFENDVILRKIKNHTIHRDKLLKTNRSFGELLQIIDKEAYEWYISL